MLKSVSPTRVFALKPGAPLLDLERYDRTPILSPIERTTLTEVLKPNTFLHHNGRVRYTIASGLERLILPLEALLTFLGTPRYLFGHIILAFLREIARRDLPFWGWSETEWVDSIGPTYAGYCEHHGLRERATGRMEMLAAAYLFGGFTPFSRFPKGSLQIRLLARCVFGSQAITAAAERIVPVLTRWGYAKYASLRDALEQMLALTFLTNRSPHLEDVTGALLESLWKQAPTKDIANAFILLSRVLVELRLLDKVLPSSHERMRLSFRQRAETTGIAPEWVEWCFRWHHLALYLSPIVRDKYGFVLLKVGRWLAQQHPEVTTPGQWTAALAADWVATVEAMRGRDFAGIYPRPRGRQNAGKPLGPRSKKHHLEVLRAFFRDLQEEPFNVLRAFDPHRAFRTPQSIYRLIGPDPRDLDPLLWARLVHAAHTLTEQDLTRTHPGGYRYPVDLVRAVALLWCYGALRVDEICRLRVGCIRWQREDVPVAETGEVLPKDAVCFLNVPVNKTSTAFLKPINPVVGKAINAWEAVRPHQPLALDPKTGERVHYLFALRGRPISRQYVNATLIPLLCKQAGVPTADERGSITSHRARATIATLLLNAPEGLSIWDLMQWLGHQRISSTEHYARRKQARIALAYTKAERNSLLIEALVDTKADAYGDVKVYYVLGADGLCSNPEWAACIYRLACRKCPFFIPAEQAQQIRAQERIKRFLEVVDLTDEELRAVQEDEQKIQENIERTAALPTPSVLRQRPKGQPIKGIPLPVITQSKHHH